MHSYRHGIKKLINSYLIVTVLTIFCFSIISKNVLAGNNPLAENQISDEQKKAARSVSKGVLKARLSDRKYQEERFKEFSKITEEYNLALNELYNAEISSSDNIHPVNSEKLNKKNSEAASKKEKQKNAKKQSLEKLKIILEKADAETQKLSTELEEPSAATSFFNRTFRNAPNNKGESKAQRAEGRKSVERLQERVAQLKNELAELEAEPDDAKRKEKIRQMKAKSEDQNSKYARAPLPPSEEQEPTFSTITGRR